jgi:NadR type nicotinamide-nucleotide adenylyltransferase
MAAAPARPLVVTLIGSESTGKTTLAALLGRHFACPWVREAARGYLESRKGPLTAQDVEPIARAQMAAEDAGRAAAGRLLILDTDLVSTLVYARHYYGSCPAWIEKAARERRADLYLLHHPDVPWVADGPFRDRPESRAEVHGLFEKALQALHARVVDLTGPYPERTARAIAAVERALESDLA